MWDTQDRTTPSGLTAVRVLAAEDNRMNRALLEAMLTPLGVDLHLATDGVEAVEMFREAAFDLVLMDAQMPAMGGVEATGLMRAFERDEGRGATPILALSANVMRHHVDGYLAAGMSGFIAKPVSLTVLVNAIQQALKARDAAAAA